MPRLPAWFQPAAVVVVVLIGAILLGGIVSVPYRSLKAPMGYDQSRLHWNTKNTTRFYADDLAGVSALVSRAMYPGTEAGVAPDAVLLYDPADWQTGLQAASLLRPLNVVLLPATEDTAAAVDALQPAGSDAFDGAQIITLNDAAAPDGDYATTSLDAAEIVAQRGAVGDSPLHAVLVDPNDPGSALLAAPWAAYSGDLVIFDPAGAPDGIPVIALGEVEGDVDAKLTAGSPAALSVAFAAYDNPDIPLFGWGFNADSLTGYRGFTLAREDDPAMALLSANLAVRGKPGPLLWAGERTLPTAVNDFIWSQRAAFYNVPSEGPFHHFYVLGDTDTITFPAQSQADYGVEIGPYKQKGVGMGGTDLLGAIWVMLGLASAGWIAFHQAKFLPFQNWVLRLAWPLMAFMIGPFGIPLYYLAHDRPIIRMEKMVMWDRPLWMQGMVATVSAVGFGAALMIVSGFITTLVGAPLIPNETSFVFWVGSPMVLIMIINYIVAVAISWPLFQTPMIAMFYGVSYTEALPKALPMVALSMFAAALAMNPGMWWLMMWNLPMMPMEEATLWFGVMFFTAFLAFLLAWPLNYALIRQERKSGLM